ncbi:hypothetical protein Leryth_010195 [Lithospermum erythrorhizon]|nr:hypothetical protein Leryth_010195 [Lithospermum erythrorhizon]
MMSLNNLGSNFCDPSFLENKPSTKQYGYADGYPAVADIGLKSFNTSADHFCTAYFKALITVVTPLECLILGNIAPRFLTRRPLTSCAEGEETKLVSDLWEREQISKHASAMDACRWESSIQQEV